MDEDNAAARAEQRALLLNNTRGAAVSRAGSLPTSAPISLRTGFFGLLVGAALLFIIMAVVIVTKQNGNASGFYAPGSDCSVVNCVGERGEPGVQGRIGPPGASVIGPSGATGGSGPKGDTGSTGGPGVCLGSPSCERGLSGPAGAKGDTGATGRVGDVGPPGYEPLFYKKTFKY